MVNDKMIVSALKNGALVRVDPEQHGELLGRPGAMQAEKGPGCDIRHGWIKSLPMRSPTTSSCPSGPGLR